MKQFLILTALLLASYTFCRANVGSFTIENGSALTLSSTNTVLDVTGSVINNGNLDAGNANIKVTDKWSNSGTFTPGTSTVTFYTTVTSTLTGQTTFYCITCAEAGKELDFTAGTTQWINATLTITGASGNSVRLRSDADGTSWFLASHSTNTVTYADIKDSDANLFPINCQNSSDSGNLNANWVFPPDMPGNLAQINGFGTSLYSMQWSTSEVAISSFTQSTPNLNNLVKYHLQVTSVTVGTFADWSQLWLSSTSALVSQAGTVGYLWPTLEDSATYWWRVWSENSVGVTSSTQTFLAFVPGNTTACFVYTPIMLSVDIISGGPIDFGKVKLGYSTATVTALTVKNSGNITETFTIKCDTSSPDGWYTTGTSTGTDLFILKAAFHPSMPTPMSAFNNHYNFVSTGTYTNSASNIFTIDGTQTGLSVPANTGNTRNLWLRLDMPGILNNYTPGQQQILLFIGAQAP